MTPLVRSSAGRNLSRLAELRCTVGDQRAIRIAPLWAVAKRYVVIVRGLTHVSDPPAGSAAYSCHGLESTSPAELAAFDRRLSIAEIERRTAAGQTCEIWWLDAQIVHFRWFSAVRTSLPYLGLDFKPQDEDLLLFEVFTVADKRVRGVHSNVALQSLKRASDRGFKRMVALCAWWNAPALRVGEKNGFEVVGTVTRWQLGPFAAFTVSGGVEVRKGMMSVPGPRFDRAGSTRAGGEDRASPREASSTGSS